MSNVGNSDVQNSYSLNQSENKSYHSGDSNETDSMNFQKYENQEEHGLVERIYDKGMGEKFNDLIKNPKTIKTMKAFITTEDDIVTVPPETTKSKLDDKTTLNGQDLLSITGFKVIDKLPPTGGETQTSYNKMIDRFRVSAGQSMFSETQFSKSRTKFNVPLEPKLSRPTTTIINLGKKYSTLTENEKNMESLEDNEKDKEDEKIDENNPLEQLAKEIDESDQDE